MELLARKKCCSNNKGWRTLDDHEECEWWKDKTQLNYKPWRMIVLSECKFGSLDGIHGSPNNTMALMVTNKKFKIS